MRHGLRRHRTSDTLFAQRGGTHPATRRTRVSSIPARWLFATTLLAIGGCGDDAHFTSAAVRQRGDRLELRPGGLELDLGLREGTFEVRDSRGRAVVVGGTAVAGFPDGTVLHAADAILDRWSVEPIDDEIGAGERITLTRSLSNPSVTLTQSFEIYADLPVFTTSLEITNRAAGSLSVSRLSPLWVDSAERRSGVFVADDPSTARALDDGAAFFLDFDERVLPADGPVLSNYNACYHDLRDGRTLLAGFLSIESAIPTIESRFDREAALTKDGDVGLTRFEARSLYVPAKTLAEGESWTSERLAIDVSSASPFDALEEFARRLARVNHVVRWVDRAPGNVVPNGWNSWSGGSGSGGYGTDIDENIILTNLEFMARELEPFGQRYFQIDDGWQLHDGDWNANPRFPHGMAWLAGRIRDRGFIPGLWIKPFVAHVESPVLGAHPEWAARLQAVDVLGVPEDERVLDLSRSEVRGWIRDTFQRVRDWGYRWVKTDFTYWFFETRDLHDPDTTLVQAYRRGLRAIREGAGDDTFHLNVAAVGPSFGLVDGSRMTLDNQPVWQGEGSAVAEQGIRPTARAVARRYYLDGNLWVNHPDLVFFRPHSDPSRPPLTFAESLANVTFVGLTGGIVKVGDRAVDLEPAAIDALRRILPTQGRAARPIDLFTRDVPEVWVLPVDTAWESWKVVGLFHWGSNRDLSTNPYSPTATGPRTVGADLAALGLDASKRYLTYEFWSDRFLGELGERVELELQPRTAAALVLRESLGRPQFLSTNRHISQGETDVLDVSWDESSRTLRGTVHALPGTELAPFQHQLTFHVPADYLLDRAIASTPAQDLGTETEGEVLRMRFRVKEAADVAWSLGFKRPGS